MAEETKKLSAKLEKLVGEIETLSVLELSELVETLQERLGVSAAAPVMAAPGGAAAPAGGEAGGEASAPSTQTVVLTAPGANKISVIKALREIDPNLGLKEAKDLTEKLPAEILKDVKTEEAKAASDKLTAAGATVELK
ncbi:MAG: 50S ribosomal protein L7/L12 [bacterium]|nr:50S ribosomal protein L7/L12 [bacterium]